MIKYVANRVFMALVTVLAAVIISLFLVHLTPGSPGALILGSGASQVQIDALNDKIGWNQPMLVQLGNYLGNVLKGDFGTSVVDGHVIGNDLLMRLPVTGSIAVLATLLSGIVGILFGVAAATRGGVTDRVINTGSGIALSLPPFWMAVLLVYLLAVQAKLLPATGYVPPAQSTGGWLASITLPVIALAIPGAAIVARTARVALLQSLGMPHIQMLRSMGTPPWRLLFLHALRSASIPIVSVLGVQFVADFAGSIIIENLFGLPGLGQAAATAITYHDMPAAQGVVVFAALVVVTVNLALDLVVGALDPRVRRR